MELPALCGPFSFSHAIFSTKPSCSKYGLFLLFSLFCFCSLVSLISRCAWWRRHIGCNTLLSAGTSGSLRPEAGLFLLPGACFRSFPLRFTLPGQLLLDLLFKCLFLKTVPDQARSHVLESHRIMNFFCFKQIVD